MKKSQTSLEYVIIIGVILAIIIPLFYYGISEPTKSIRINEASSTVNVLAKKADSIGALGSGSRDYVWITIPSGVIGSTVDNGTIELEMTTLGYLSAYTRANVTGSIPKEKGIYKMVVENIDSIVHIGPLNDTTPPKITSTSPSGTVASGNIELKATTDEPAVCKFSLTDQVYDSMEYFFSGTRITHNYNINLSAGNYVYYARCKDYYDNAMTSSAKINFTVIEDAALPVIQNLNVTPTNLFIGDNICINATVTDDTGISSVWATITLPLPSPPYNNQINVTLTDTGATCAGTSGDNIYGVTQSMQVAGFSYLTAIYANDTANNLVQKLPGIPINVTATGPSQGLTYVPVSASLYLKSSSTELTTPDSALTTSDMSIHMTDDDKNTPPSAYKFKWSSNSWEGFNFELNKNPSTLKAISLRLKVVDAGTIPYNTTIYIYTEDLNGITLANSTHFPITQISNPGVNRGFNEVIITDTIKSMPNNTIIKVRVVPNSDMYNNVMHISEADFGIA